MKIYFFDDQRIATRVNTNRVYGFPKPIEEEQENNCASFGLPVVIKGTKLAPYIMYSLQSKEVMYNGKMQNKTFHVMSKSDDCINWTPLNNNLQLEGKYFDNQILPLGEFSDILTVIYNDKEKEDKFRLFVCSFDWERGDYELKDRMFVSKDGISFKEKPCNLNKDGCEAYAGSYYNHLKDCYTFIIRPAWADRRAAITETKDFINFSKIKLAIQVDSLDAREEEIYGMPTFNFGDIFIGLPHVFHTTSVDYGLANKYKGGHMDFQLAYSYDGEVFQRSLREPFIKRGTPSDLSYGMISCYSVTEIDDYYIFTCNITTSQHAFKTPNSKSMIKSYKLEKDRFIGLEAIGGEAVLKTRGLIFKKNNLAINIEVPYGYATARLVDDDIKKVVEGFDFEDCDMFYGNSHKWMPKWKKDIMEVSNRVLSLEIKYFNGIIWDIHGDFIISYTTMAARRYNNFKILPPDNIF